jgi:hypothetical protein
LLLAMFLPCHRNVSAATIYATGFEDPPFHAGQPLIGQDGWQGLGPSSPGGRAIISTEKPSEGLQAFRILGGDLDPLFFDSLGGVYNRTGFDYDVAAEGYPRIHVDADIRLDGPQTADEYFSVFFGALTPTAVSGVTIASNGLASSLDVAPIPIGLGQYNHYQIDLALGNENIFTMRVNGELLGSHESLPTSFFEGIQFGCSAPSPSSDSLNRDVAAYTVYIDNVSITTTVPEPRGIWMEIAGIVGIVVVGRFRIAPALEPGCSRKQFDQ